MEFLTIAVCLGFWHNCQGVYEGDNESVSETLHTGQIVLSCPTIYHATFISPLFHLYLLRDNFKRERPRTIREWVENFRPVRQRTIRGETTKRQSRSPASPQPYCASKGNFFWRCHCTKETIAIAKKREICLASYAKCC